MAPTRPAKLDLSSAVSAAPSTSGATPPAVTFVVSGSASVARVDALAQSWKENGFLGNSKVVLRGLAYESDPAKDDIDRTPDLFKAASTAPTNLPITLIQPLPVKVGEQLPPQLPPPRAPAHTSLNYSLPTIRSADDIKKNQQAWLEALKQADEQKYTLELALKSPFSRTDKDEESEVIRAAVEELLGMAHAEAAKGEQRAEADRGFYVFDAFASPPLHLASSQLLRSQELADWAGFISRLALHPRTYIKLSPLTVSALNLASEPRAADAVTAAAVPSVASSTVQAVKEATTSAVQGVEKTLHGAAASEDPNLELRRRLRVFLDVIVEAFGLERIIWSANLSAGQLFAGDATKDGVQNALKGSADEEAVKAWYTAVLDSLTSMGLDGKSVEGIFGANASFVYRL